MALGLRPRSRYAARRLHARGATSCDRCRPGVHGGLLARCVARCRPDHGRRACSAVPVRQHVARRANFGAPAPRISRVQRPLLSNVRRRYRAHRSARERTGARVQLRHHRGSRLHAGRVPGGGLARHVAVSEGEARRRYRLVHARAQQLSSDGWRRLCHAAGRAGRVRQAGRDSAAPHR